MCKSEGGCQGYSWCTCPAGCDGYKFQDCVMKRMPFAEFPMNQVTGKHMKFISGVPMVDINDDPQCSIGSPCIQSLFSCSTDQIESSIQCADDTCNFEIANFQGELLYLDYELQMGIPISSPAECCNVCKETPGCNVWQFCTEMEMCYSQNSKRGLSCQLKSAASQAYYQKGPRQPWVGGFLGA
eukprot:TRINITY_DN25912_c0_g1_i1.p2 TRINITY_DN25912_c0_g1~~TRINITY_DN25912_c0_g1_i1.p2  ORF type:complete len:184 (+),score=16.36 TRINITY_DN25912_c0_g1_i1:284-835(+)